MTIVGSFDVHRKQLTFDYVDTETGEVRSGRIRPATRLVLRQGLAQHCPVGDAEFALEGCTGWRYVVGSRDLHRENSTVKRLLADAE
jgi:transposase